MVHSPEPGNQQVRASGEPLWNRASSRAQGSGDAHEARAPLQKHFAGQGWRAWVCQSWGSLEFVVKESQ